MARRRLSANARMNTPLARTYREAKRAYQQAGKALRRSCQRGTECGYSSSSLTAKHVRAMRQEFLGAAAHGGTNEDILRAQLGHLGVRDQTQWEAVNEKYETKAQTFEEAFDVLAKAAGKRRPDWRKFDLNTLRDCRGLEALELPARVHEALNAEEHERAAFAEVPF